MQLRVGIEIGAFADDKPLRSRKSRTAVIWLSASSYEDHFTRV